MRGGACESMRLRPLRPVQPDGWARGERERVRGPCDVTSLSLSLSLRKRQDICPAHFGKGKAAKPKKVKMNKIAPGARYDPPRF